MGQGGWVGGRGWLADWLAGWAWLDGLDWVVLVGEWLGGCRASRLWCIWLLCSPAIHVIAPHLPCQALFCYAHPPDMGLLTCVLQVLTIQGFLAVRKHADRILLLVEMMQGGQQQPGLF